MAKTPMLKPAARRSLEHHHFRRLSLLWISDFGVRNIVNIVSILLLLWAVSLAGCGGHDSTVSGKVTLNGAALDRGTVTFHPDGGGAAAMGTVQPGGQYSIATGREGGLKPGDYTVTVFANEAPPEGNAEVVPKALTPVIYSDKSTSPLSQ
jgi:hypothetical protein